MKWKISGTITANIWLLFSFKTIKQNYMRKSPYEKWYFIRNIHATLVKLVGVDVMNDNFKVNIRTLIPIYVEVNYLCLLTYTLIYYRNEPFKALIATPSMGILIPVSLFWVKIHFTKRNYKIDCILQCLIHLILALYPPTRVLMDSLYYFGAKNIYANSDISPKTRTVCDKMAINLIVCSIRVNLMVFFSYLLLICGPLYKNFFTDEHEMMLAIILPFIDPETESGFTINLINQMFSVLLGTFVIPGTELITCILKNNVTAAAAVIENSFIEFKSFVGIHENSSINLACEFRNIILKILDFDRFASVFKNICKVIQKSS